MRGSAWLAQLVKGPTLGFSCREYESFQTQVMCVSWEARGREHPTATTAGPLSMLVCLHPHVEGILPPSSFLVLWAAVSMADDGFPLERNTCFPGPGDASKVFLLSLRPIALPHCGAPVRHGSGLTSAFLSSPLFAFKVKTRTLMLAQGSMNRLAPPSLGASRLSLLQAFLFPVFQAGQACLSQPLPGRPLLLPHLPDPRHHTSQACVPLTEALSGPSAHVTSLWCVPVALPLS